MKGRGFRGVLPVVWMLASVCLIALPVGAERAPQFRVRSLNGGSVSNSSLRGRITLLQFWATWCPYCRRDESAVDEVARMFSGQGLTVLAINVGESETKVRSYLRKHPRACRIALNEKKDVFRSFGAKGYPYYVLMDRQGRILDRSSGSGGKESLLYMLRQAGLSPQRPAKHGGKRRQANSGKRAGAQVLEVPGAQMSGRSVATAGTDVPAGRLSKTVFILADGERLESDRYTIDSQSLRITVGKKLRTIALADLDRKATLAENRKRGVRVNIPAGRNEVFLGF
jgi:thiol-disulfide isomerase/thioredoxin